MISQQQWAPEALDQGTSGKSSERLNMQKKVKDWEEMENTFCLGHTLYVIWSLAKFQRF